MSALLSTFGMETHRIHSLIQEEMLCLLKLVTGKFNHQTRCSGSGRGEKSQHVWNYENITLCVFGREHVFLTHLGSQRLVSGPRRVWDKLASPLLVLFSTWVIPNLDSTLTQWGFRRCVCRLFL